MFILLSCYYYRNLHERQTDDSNHQSGQDDLYHNSMDRYTSDPAHNHYVLDRLQPNQASICNSFDCDRHSLLLVHQKPFWQTMSLTTLRMSTPSSSRGFLLYLLHTLFIFYKRQIFPIINNRRDKLPRCHYLIC